MELRFQIVLAFLSVLTSGCVLYDRAGSHTPEIEHASFESDSSREAIYVVGHGWHTGIVVPVSAIPPEVWPEIRHFDGLDYVEFGWGDEGFYRAKKITVGLCLKAALLPTPSVLHVAGFRGRVEDFYQVSDIVELEATDEQLSEIGRFVNQSLSRNESGDALILGFGIYGESYFFRSNGKYYFPKTCNVWTARALRESGYSVRSAGAITAESVLKRARAIGTVRQVAADGIKQAALSGE